MIRLFAITFFLFFCFFSNSAYAVVTKDYISVKDYGCKGDGITDDTLCIQNAINEASINFYQLGAYSMGGATVFFPAGRYMISGPINITSRGVGLVGVNYETSIISYASPEAKITVGNETPSDPSIPAWKYDTYRQKFANLNIDANGQTDIGITIQNAEELYFQSFGVLNAKKVGMSLKNVNISTFNDLRIESNGDTGLLINGSSHLNIENGNFYNNANMIKVTGKTYNVNIDHTWFENFTNAILIDNASNHALITPIHIDHNRFLSDVTQSRAVKITNTMDTNVLQTKLDFTSNSLLMQNSDYFIEIAVGNTKTYPNTWNTKSFQIKSTDNYSDFGPNASFVYSDNWNLNLIYQDNVLATTQVPALSGIGSVIGVDRSNGGASYVPYNKFFGSIILPETLGDNNITGELRMNNNSQYPEMYDGSKYEPILLALSGPTSDRPTIGNYIGRFYFDTSLNKPIWWSGTKWVDATGSVTAPTVSSLTSAPSSVTLTTYGQTQQLAITANYSNGTTATVTNVTYYSSSAPSVATVNSSTGLVTAVANGTTVITATYGGVSVQVNVTVNTPTVNLSVNNMRTSSDAGIASSIYGLLTTTGSRFVVTTDRAGKPRC